MNQPHPQAEILRAIADGKTIQHLGSLSRAWYDISTEYALYYLHEGCKDLRIKPETVMVNGVECEKPCRESFSSVTVYCSGSKGIRTEFFFQSDESSEKAFNALIAPFKDLK